MTRLYIGIDKGKVAAFAIGVVLAGLVLGAGLVFASDGDRIHACVDEKGKITIVDSEDECKEKDFFLEWNITGPQGEQGSIGLTGPQGEIGPQGDPGADGVSGWEKVETQQTIKPDEARIIFAYCPPGKKVLGGGWKIPSDVRFFESRPYLDNIWTVQVYNPNSFDKFVTVYAICADVTP